MIVSKATEATSIMYRKEMVISALSNAGIFVNELKMMVSLYETSHPSVLLEAK